MINEVFSAQNSLSIPVLYPSNESVSSSILLKADFAVVLRSITVVS